MDVVILAGGTCSPELEQLAGTRYRAMIPINGKPIIEIIKEATSFLGEPIIVGGPPNLGPKQTEAGSNAIESLLNGMKLVTSDKFLVITSDLPCLSKESIEDFLKQCKDNAVFHYPIIDVSKNDPRFEGMKRTTLKLREGCFTGGNIMLADRQKLDEVIPVLQRAYELRKSPIKIAGMVGFGTLLKVLVGQICPYLLTINSLEKAIAKFLTQPVLAVVSTYPELGADIDNAEQYKIFTNNLKKFL